MQNALMNTADLDLLEGLAELLMQVGRDRAADVIYAALEAEGLDDIERPALTLVHSSE